MIFQKIPVFSIKKYPLEEFSPKIIIGWAIDIGINVPTPFVEWYEKQRLKLTLGCGNQHSLRGKEETPPDYNYWLNIDLWSLYETCALLNHLNPDWEDGVRYYLYEQTLPLEWAIQASVKLNLLECSYSGRYIYLQTKHVIEWAINKKLNIPAPLIEWHEKQQAPAPAAPAENTPQQTKHSSELLAIMYEAIAELWENHDPKSPPTLPIVEAWLKEKGYNRSQVEIKAIDKIMRPDRYKGGKTSNNLANGVTL